MMMKKEKNILVNFATAGVTTVLVAVVFICGLVGCAGTRSENASGVSKARAAETKPLSGAELYAINCNRCHPERSAVERNAAEWDTIMIHMRARANLPAAQARAIREYLQANSGN